MHPAEPSEQQFQTWPDEPGAAAMMDDLYNALHDNGHGTGTGHPASPDTPKGCWERLLNEVRFMRQDRWNLWVETGRVIVHG